jgi:Tol biopolymer transport system component
MSSVDQRVRVSRRTWQVIAVSAALSAVGLALPAQASAVSAATGVTTRVSVSTTGAQANGTSTSTAISADGRYVAFGSEASNLVPDDTNNTPDVFVRDRWANVTTRVSVSGDETQAVCCEGSFAPVISTDGRYVVFTSDAPNLVPGDTNHTFDVFVRDRLAGATRRVSVSSGGVQANAEGQSYPGGISADGRYVVFESSSRTLVPDDTNLVADVFLRDVQAGITRRISLSRTGAQTDGGSYAPAISADGRYVTFSSGATNLVAGDTNSSTDAFLRDVRTGATRRISVSSTSAEANSHSFSPVISADGRYVAFSSIASNLVSGDTNSSTDVFLRDWQSGVTRRISVSSTGAQATGGNSFGPAISPDGRHVAFSSDAPNLVPGDSAMMIDVFIRDWGPGLTRRVSVSRTGRQANGSSEYPAISSGGRHVAFRSWATNLVPGDTNGRDDIFVRVT